MKIGTIHIECPVVLAPMESVTDAPFRLICKEYGADLVYTEFVNSEGIVRASTKTFSKMTFSEKERPIGIQLYGGNEESMYRAAQQASELNPDFIDINCGCWVKNVVKNGAGADLLRDLPRMEKIIKLVVRATQLPVTVKTRLGWDSQNINILDIAKVVEQSGAVALTIHCRTRAQGHKGEPDFSWIEKVKAVVTIPIIANGSIDTPQKAKAVVNATGCDGIMIGRGAIGNPWIFKQVKDFILNNAFSIPTTEERFSTIVRHLRLAVDHKGERSGVIEFRKFYTGYLKGLPNAATVRAELMKYKELQPILDILSVYCETLAKSESMI